MDHVIYESDQIEIGPTVYSPNSTYTVEKCLAQGDFGKVFEVSDWRSRKFAMKVNRNETNKQICSNKNEAENLQTIKKNFKQGLPLLYCEESFAHGDNYCLVTELLSGDLNDIWLAKNPMKLDRLASIARQLFTGLAALHKMNLVHCDLKPDNIMIEKSSGQERIKIVDFGLCIEKKWLHEWQGIKITAFVFRAPEVFLGLPLNEKVDLWSIGVILHDFYTGEHLFDCQDSSPLRVKQMSELVGLPDNYSSGVHYDKYFHKDPATGEEEWTDESLKTSDKYKDLYKFKDLEKHGFNYKGRGFSAKGDTFFCDLLYLLLEPNPSRRISASTALQETFCKYFKENY